MLASVRSKSLTVDEPAHAVSGASYWIRNDYRLNPENGNLPQRWMALPLLSSVYSFPTSNSDAWRLSDSGTMGDQWLNRMGNNTRQMIFQGRAMCALWAVVLGSLVWWWSRSIFGRVGGLVSLLVFTLDPSVLANGPLMTSDTACALFFFGSVLAIWAGLRRITYRRVIVSALAMGGLFVSKMSAILVLPMGLTLGLIALFSRKRVSLEIGGQRDLIGWPSRLTAFLAIALVHIAVTLTVIWGFDGFRFAAFGPESPAGSRLEYAWNDVLGGPQAAIDSAPQAFRFLRKHHLLPEAYIFGQAHAWRDSRLRSAFLNGRQSLTGWWWFFPYSFLVKTPFPILGIIALSVFSFRRRAFDGMIPLLVLFCFYWAAAITTHLNIGHRHILPIYPPLFVLCGAASLWLRPLPFGSKLGWSKSLRGIVCVLLMALALETALNFPNYLTYFNAIAGGRNHGYRHFVDSSLDWGQDLPALRDYLHAHPQSQPAYFSYFGMGSPDYYQIPARLLYSVRGEEVPPAIRTLRLSVGQAGTGVAEALRKYPEYQVIAGARRPDRQLDLTLMMAPSALRLTAGTYCISASMLQPVMYDLRGPVGPWNERFERTYLFLYSLVKPLLSDDLKERDAALPTYRPDEWSIILSYFEMFRFARLTAFLREREPSDTVNGSILVYRLSSADIARAVDGPAPKLGSDLPVQSGLFVPPVLPLPFR